MKRHASSITQSLSVAASRGVLDARGDAVQDVEQQRLEQRGIRAHRLEVEHLQPVDRQRVLDVVEELGVAAALDPLVQASRQSPRQQVREREEPPLRAIEDVEVLDRLVDLAVLDVAEPIPVRRLRAALGRTRAESAGARVSARSANGLIVTPCCRRPSSR